MCGIVGILSHTPVGAELYDSLIHLQHRGQDAAGIMTCSERFHSHTGQGLVREIFSPGDIERLPGNLGIAHNRYPTTGAYSIDEIQPFWIGSPYGIAMAHNGNLTNYKSLAEELLKNHKHLNSTSDSEVLMHIFAEGFGEQTLATTEEDFFDSICKAVDYTYSKAKGAYSVVSLIIGKGLIAFRDPHGLRPLVYGTREIDGKTDTVFASENTMFFPLDFKQGGDVAPGEVVFVSQKTGKVYRKQLRSEKFTPCMFEYVYFSRPDAYLDDVSVYRARLRMGQNLAKQWKKENPGCLPDIVIPAPFTANTCALAFAHELGVRYSEGLYKNPFIGRTFIMPSTAERKRSVKYKLTPQFTEIRNKDVLIVDDSIVRGTTSQEIVRMVRECGANKVYFASSCPPIISPCFYGVDMPTQKELIAHNRSTDEVQEYLDVDILIYQSIEGLNEAIMRHAIKIDSPCMACLNGKYITGDIKL